MAEVIWYVGIDVDLCLIYTNAWIKYNIKESISETRLRSRRI